MCLMHAFPGSRDIFSNLQQNTRACTCSCERLDVVFLDLLFIHVDPPFFFSFSFFFFFSLTIASVPWTVHLLTAAGMTLLRGLSQRLIIVPPKVSVSPNYRTVMYRDWTCLHGRLPKAVLVYRWHKIRIRTPDLYAITMT